MFPSFSYPAAQSVSPAILSPHFLSLPSFPSHHSKLPQSQLQPKQPNKKMRRHTLRWWCGSCEVGGGYPDDGLGVKGKNGTVREQGSSKLEPAQYEALLKGLFKLEDMNVDDASEEVAVEIAAQGVLRKRVDEMEAGFMMALDYMMQLADSYQDDSVPTFISEDNGNSACSSRSKTACKTCLVREEARNIMGDGC